MGSFKRSQQKHVKKPYRVRNWPEYEAGLRNRGSLIVWLNIDKDSGEIPGWYAKTKGPRRPGRKRRYSNLAIETMKRISLLFSLPNRQTVGFFNSLFELLNISLDVPHHTRLSRRGKTLGNIDLCNRKHKRPIHLLIDSSGLKVHVGNKRNPPKRRDYRKIHIGIDEHSGEAVACDLTSKSASDGSRVPSLLNQIDRPLSSLKADASYDTKGVYEAAENHSENHSPRVVIPPQKNATIHDSLDALKERNRNIRSRKKKGKRKWQSTSGYNDRSKVEAFFSRYKRIIGPSMKARNLANQRLEVKIGCQILNKMNSLGKPNSCRIG